MDFAEAKVFSESLLSGGAIAGWQLLEYLSHGKSAVVMRARKGQMTAVVKVFHPGLIEAYGREAQLIRVSRERELINKNHPNIVRIIDAGTCASTSKIFVIMDVAPGKPLSKVLKLIPRENITRLIEQLASAARQLEDWGFTHRDIKPDNIHISEDLSSLMLLDFGVLKPLGDDSATSLQVSKAFVGTHQYSPPEMIHGREEDTLNGWRAITFYQLGAVLHDLIVQKPIFEYATIRHADLVTSIDNDLVHVRSDEVDARLCNLATRCLLKRPCDRLDLVRWEDFMFSGRESQKTSLQARKDALLRQRKVSRVVSPIDVIENAEKRRLKEVSLLTKVQSARAQFDEALAELSGFMPARKIKLDGGAYPNPSITVTFVAAPDVGFVDPFRIQISIALYDDRSSVDVYARASKGLAETEVGWTHLGPALESLDGFADQFQEWMLTIVEELNSL